MTYHLSMHMYDMFIKYKNYIKTFADSLPEL